MHDFTRRGAVLSSLALGACAQQTRALADPAAPNDPRFAAIERRIGGRVGVAALDTATGARLTHRADQYFAMCSTFKWLLATQMVHIDMHAPGHLARSVSFSADDLLDYAPVAREHLARGEMTIEQMCAGAVVLSDNTCANLLLGQIGGPPGLTHYLRQEGDRDTQLDRFEPELNEVAADDDRDSTTPSGMVWLLNHFLVQDESLNAAAQAKLIGWMVESPTGRERLRAGLPSTWRVGDKTGTWNGENNASNDVAIAWPPGRAPILIASYLHRSTAEPAARNAAHAEVARIIVEEWG
ncbi:MAG: class A beta-lactamase [Hyphomonadaceae bacterium]